MDMLIRPEVSLLIVWETSGLFWEQGIRDQLKSIYAQAAGTPLLGSSLLPRGCVIQAIFACLYQTD